MQVTFVLEGTILYKMYYKKTFFLLRSLMNYSLKKTARYCSLKFNDNIFKGKELNSAFLFFCFEKNNYDD